MIKYYLKVFQVTDIWMSSVAIGEYVCAAQKMYRQLENDALLYKQHTSKSYCI